MAAVDATAVLNNPALFEALVEQLLSADNDARKGAEAMFDQCKAHPDPCVLNLLRCLRECQQDERRAFCAIMLRKVLTQQEPNLWSTSSAATQGSIKTELLNALVQEQQRSVLFKVCDTISELGADLLPKSAWPELLPGLQQLATASEPRHVEAALHVLATLATYRVDALGPLLGPLQQLLGQCLGHASLKVQVAALKAAAAVINSLDAAPQRDPWQALLPSMLAALGRCLTGDEEAAQEVLEALIELADSHPRFLRGRLSDVVSAMLQITTASQLEASTRVLAAEVLVTLCEARDKAPGMMRKLPAFVGQLFEALMGFLLDIEDEPAWHGADSDAHEEEGNGELFDDGQEALDRIAIALGGKTLVPAAAALLPVWLGDADWRKRHAALICLAQIAEGCAKVMSGSMEQLVQMCLAGLQDPNPKVRWAACQALGQMCTDLGPDLQESHGAVILPALMTAMGDFNAPRVQAHASAAVVNFSEGCEPDLMAPYLDGLINQLITLLQRGKRMVQEGALTALASVADCAQEAFVKYYDAVMPLLSTLLLNAQDKQYRLLRAKALECVSLVGMAVGKDRFRGAAADVMSYLQQLQAQGLDPDDPTSSYMLQAGARLCKCLGGEFLPYLGVVMPPLLEAAQLKVDVSLTEGELADLDDEDDDVEHIQLGDKILSIRTSLMEEKATACNMICCYVEELKEGFLPYVQRTTEIMVPLLKFYFHEEVRRAAVQSLPHLVRCASLAAEKGVPGATPAAAAQLLSGVWDPLIAALKKEPDTEVQASMLDALGELVEQAEPGGLSQPAVEGAFDAFRQILAAADQRRVKRSERVAAEDFDEEEREALEAENEAEEELYDQVGNCLGNFLRKFGDAALPYVEQLMPSIAPLLHKNRPAEERRIALCIVDDMLEHSAAARAKYAPQLLNVLLDECMADHEDLRQCAVYGVGVVAAASPDLLKPHAALAQQRVLAIIQHPQARSEDNEMATDNAVAALGALLEHHSDVLDGGLLGEAWVGALPIKADKVEAAKVHEQLLRLVEAQDARVLGPSNKNLPHIAGVVVQVLGRGTDLLDEGVAPRMVALAHMLKAQLPAPMEATFAGLSDKQKAAYTAMMEGKLPPQ